MNGNGHVAKLSYCLATAAAGWLGTSRFVFLLIGMDANERTTTVPHWYVYTCARLFVSVRDTAGVIPYR
jgi:hypothetical protein